MRVEKMLTKGKHPKIWLSSPHMGGQEQEYVQEAFDQNWIAPMGPNVDGFESDITNYINHPHCVALSSGTAALHLGLILADVQRSDYVICQSMTFSASANPIAYLGATPIFIDSDPETWNISTELMEEAICDLLDGKLRNPQTNEMYLPRLPKAIIPVHLYGMPAKMDKIMEVSQKYGIPVIEDAAESLGSKFDDIATGTMGEMGILSFNGNKIITTSGGGALVSSSDAIIQKARFLATQAKEDAPHYEHKVIGYNYRLSNIAAGIGRGQMKILDSHIARRREINQWYRSLLAEIEGVHFQEEPDARYFSNYWLTALTIKSEKCGVSADSLRKSLMEDNIESRPLWKPMHLQPVFAYAPAIIDGTSEELFGSGLCLPSGSNLGEADLTRIERIIRNMFKI
jgi:dTDP-4-amino-4,6-dideoxygalactose transaminase